MSVKILGLELTNICNLRCKTCYARESERELKHMPYEEVCKLLEEGKELGMVHLTIGSSGEPTLYPKFLDVLKKATEMGYLIRFHTNGTYDSSMNREIAKANISNIDFSIDGLEPAHKRIRNSGKYEQIVNNAIELKKLRKPVRAYMCVMNQTEEEQKEFIEFWKSHGIQPMLDPYIENWEYKKFPIGSSKQIPDTCYKFNGGSVSVLVDGSTTFCDADLAKTMRYGNVVRDGITGFLNNKEKKKYIENHKRFGKPMGEACKNCKLVRGLKNE